MPLRFSPPIHVMFWKICTAGVTAVRNIWLPSHPNDASRLRRNEWMNEWVSEWVSEWATDWLTDWMNEWMSEWVSDWVKEHNYYICIYFYGTSKDPINKSNLCICPAMFMGVCRRTEKCRDTTNLQMGISWEDHRIYIIYIYIAILQKDVVIRVSRMVVRWWNWGRTFFGGSSTF